MIIYVRKYMYSYGCIVGIMVTSDWLIVNVPEVDDLHLNGYKVELGRPLQGHVRVDDQRGGVSSDHQVNGSFSHYGVRGGGVVVAGIGGGSVLYIYICIYIYVIDQMAGSYNKNMTNYKNMYTR